MTTDFANSCNKFSHFQVIIYGNLLIYNLIHSEMEMVMISHGKRDAKFSYSQTINTTTIKRNQLVSIAVPDSHKLSFKVRYRPSQNSSEHCYWSGLIPLVTFQQPSNQNSWMVKGMFEESMKLKRLEVL